MSLKDSQHAGGRQLSTEYKLRSMISSYLSQGNLHITPEVTNIWAIDCDN